MRFIIAGVRLAKGDPALRQGRPSSERGHGTAGPAARRDDGQARSRVGSPRNRWRDT
ncbi:hypothetical protein SCOCK_50190 [Actinacidiphila cocklensis]|uniref:Uncharacterized protein n=1 Tax=Actinacidiphila cocklensis TaxID=887465 RepID=A0A9W4EAC6_9ACTN|nr:hypothetical protein SCOCK_50190 [Actinacidiphila cocklensis]